ncbi:MAG: class I SAM-dependent methyltransferase [Christensenellaceae bacterium]|nr:class I SAM-dependent methyltransferase [Christensenellaceae bacterium]
MNMEKNKIEKNTVQETLIVPLYGRKMCSEKFPELYTDVFAERLCNRLDYDFSELEKKKNSFLYQFGALEAAMRQLDMIWEIKEYLKKHPKATIVNLGCGLDETGKACDNGLCNIVNVDFPDVISVRNQLISEQNREKNIACDLKDYSWMEEVDGSNGVIFFAAGVFHYFKKEEVKLLVLELSKRYSGGCLVFDSVGKMGLKLMMKKILKNMDIDDVGGYFYVNNPREDLNWSEKINVNSKGYMLGYYDMKSPGVNFLHRLLANAGDKVMKMSINRMDFE